MQPETTLLSLSVLKFQQLKGPVFGTCNNQFMALVLISLSNRRQRAKKMKLNGNTILITGGGSGIGLELAKELLKKENIFKIIRYDGRT